MSDWLRVRVTVDEESLAQAESVLEASGAISVTLTDAGDVPVHEPAPGETPVWPQTVIEGLYEGRVTPVDVVAALVEAGLVTSADAVAFETLEDQDWERSWMDTFQPMRFGESIWICPWHLEPDPEWPLVIRLDPGLAFGSGTHPTTALCLEWIDRLKLTGAQVIDYGSGSGILAVACALKGARRVICVDHDSQALAASEDNARRNGVEERVESCLPEDFTAAQPAQLVLANILAGPLIELAPTLSGLLAVDGILVLSGILPGQADEVGQAYSNLVEPVDRSERDGWVRLVYRRVP